MGRCYVNETGDRRSRHIRPHRAPSPVLHENQQSYLEALNLELLRHVSWAPGTQAPTCQNQPVLSLKGIRLSCGSGSASKGKGKVHGVYVVQGRLEMRCQSGPAGTTEAIDAAAAGCLCHTQVPALGMAFPWAFEKPRTKRISRTGHGTRLAAQGSRAMRGLHSCRSPNLFGFRQHMPRPGSAPCACFGFRSSRMHCAGSFAFFCKWKPVASTGQVCISDDSTKSCGLQARCFLDAFTNQILQFEVVGPSRNRNAPRPPQKHWPSSTPLRGTGML